MQAFFKPGSAINPDHKEKYLHVLAYAVSGHDKPLDSDQSLEEFQHTKKAVETAHLICSRASVSHAELQVEIPTIFECMKVPVVCMGVVRWVEHMLTDSTFFEEAAESSSLFLVLLDEATSCHSLQHPHVLELLERLIEGSYPMLEVSVQVSGGGGGGGSPRMLERLIEGSYSRLVVGGRSPRMPEGLIEGSYPVGGGLHTCWRG